MIPDPPETESPPPEPRTNESLFERKHYDIGQCRTISDSESNPAGGASNLAPPQAPETSEASLSDDPTVPPMDEEPPPQASPQRDKKEESDRLEHAFRDERIIDKNQDFFQDDEEDELERALREQEAEFTSQGTDLDELECLFKVCSRKRGTSEEIEKARRAFASIQGSEFETMVLTEINGADQVVSALLDIYLDPVNLKTAEADRGPNAGLSTKTFRLDDYI